MSYEKMFEDENFCNTEILEARKLFSNKNATFDQYQNLIKGLMIMLIYCPEKLTSMVEATIREAERRQLYQVNKMLDSLL